MSPRITLSGVAVLCVLAPAATPRPEQQASVAVFTHVTVVPMDGPRILRDQIVVVRDGRIANLGAADAITPPDGALIIDGRGRFLMPGLADMHVHLTTPGGLLLYLANGITTVRNMAGRPAHLAWRDSIARGQMLGPTIYTAGPILDGPHPAWPGSAVVETAADADSVVRAQRAAGYDFIKVYDGLSLPAYRAIVRAARRAGLPVAGHVPDSVPLDTAIAAGQAIEHLWGFTTRVQPDDPRVAIRWRALPSDEIPVRQAALGDALLAGTLTDDDFIDVARLDSITRAVRAAGVWVTPTLVVFERPILSGAALAEASRAPEMAYVLPQVVRSWPTVAARPNDLPPSIARFRAAEQHVRMRIILALHRAGCGILAGTDTPNPLVVPGFSLHRELRLLVEAGLTPFEALEAATRKPAEFLGVPGTFGTVRVGARADLVLLDANPLDDVANAAQPVGVMVRGRWLPEETLRAELDSLARVYRQQ